MTSTWRRSTPRRMRRSMPAVHIARGCVFGVSSVRRAKAQPAPARAQLARRAFCMPRRRRHG
eukprot:6961478-Heterocapsa_arctica.AAC.1